MMTPLFIVDAFTHKPFAGNPAAVCPLPGPMPDDWMQAVASEMNLSETAFTWPEGDVRRLRWFTPLAEVDLCGHATLATAHVLWTENAAETPLRFITRSGPLTCTRSGDRIEMDFPAKRVEACAAPPGLLESLNVRPVWVGFNKMDYLVEVATPAEVHALKPDMGLLAKIPVRGVIVTATGTGDHDFVSRFFAPAFGVPEDPVTGSAHCALAPYWAAKLGRSGMVGYQASNRGGYVSVNLDRDRVLLGGSAVTVVKGNLSG